MPEQAPYPEVPWWKTQQQEYPTISTEELKEWHKTGKGSVGYKTDPIDKLMENYQGGFMIDKDHPGLKELEGQADIFQMERPGRYLFVKPRVPSA